MKTLLIDCRFITEKLTGFSSYQIQILKGLYEQNFFQFYKIKLLVNSWYNKNRHFYDIGSPDAFQWQVCTVKFLSPFEIFTLPKEIRKASCQAFHSPTFSIPSIFPSLNIPSAQTIHDLNHIQFGSTFKKLYYQFILKPYIKRVPFLLTISETSKKELQNWIHRENINIIANSLELTIVSLPALPIPLQKISYFFVIAPFKSHKNLSFLFSTFKEWQMENPQYSQWKLITTVSATDIPPLLQWKNILPIQDLKLDPSIPNNIWVKALLKNCKAHFFPSIYEGFGLPPCEAILAGVPCVVSSISSHQEALLGIPEVHWVSPVQKEEWKKAFSLAAEGKLAHPTQASQNLLLKKWNRSNSTLILNQIYRKMLGQ